MYGSCEIRIFRIPELIIKIILSFNNFVKSLINLNKIIDFSQDISFRTGIRSILGESNFPKISKSLFLILGPAF